MNLYNITLATILILVSSFCCLTNSAAQNIYPTESNSSVFLDGGDIQLIIPNVARGTWLKGLFNVEEDSLRVMGGYGAQGDTNGVQRYFINFGSKPWREPGGIFLLPNGNFGVGNSFPQATLDVAGKTSCDTSLVVGGYPNPDYRGIVVNHEENTSWNFFECKNEDGTHFKIDGEGNLEAGHAKFCEVLVNEDWCDYVFDETYELPSLKEEKKHIEKKGYLLGFESEEAMAGEISLADVTKRQQVKIEEMMLHLIELSEQVLALKQENEKLKKRKQQ